MSLSLSMALGLSFAIPAFAFFAAALAAADRRLTIAVLVIPLRLPGFLSWLFAGLALAGGCGWLRGSIGRRFAGHAGSASGDSPKSLGLGAGFGW